MTRYQREWTRYYLLLIAVGVSRLVYNRSFKL